MFQGPSGRKTFVIACKKCRRDVTTGVTEFPFQSIVIECPLCGEKRRYLPSEIFLGESINSSVTKSARKLFDV
jgi:RNase P subunit RPR2